MRRWGWIVGIVVLLGLAVWASPFIGGAELAGDAERGDTAAVMERVNLPALRRSLARQIAAAYLAATGKAEKMGAFGRSIAGAAATTVADPYLAELLTPDNITALIGRGKIGSVTLGGKAMAVNHDLPRFPELIHGDLLSMLTASYFDGIVSFVIMVAAGAAPDDLYGVHMRLDGLTWKLSGLDLPKPIIDEMARSVLAAQAQTPPT